MTTYVKFCRGLAQIIAVGSLALGAAHMAVAIPLPSISVETKGGMVPVENKGWSQTLTIYADGRVEFTYKKNAAASEVVTPLARLDIPVATALFDQAAALDYTSDLKAEAGQPCQGAPTSLYRYGTNGYKTFAKEVTCIKSFLKGSMDESMQLAATLDAMGVLVSYLPHL